MSPAGKGKSLPSPRPIVKILTHPSQLPILLRGFGRCALATQANWKQVSPNDVTLTVDSKPQTRLQPNLHIPSTLSPLKTYTPRNPSPAQVLCSARCALLKDKDKLSVNRHLRRHVNKKTGALKLLQQAPTTKTRPRLSSNTSKAQLERTIFEKSNVIGSVSIIERLSGRKLKTGYERDKSSLSSSGARNTETHHS
jgi:hypothetical protein